MPRKQLYPRRICFVSGTRAEFGLMESTLRALQKNSGVALQIIITGMHLDRARGGEIRRLRQQGWKIDTVIPWPSGNNDPTRTAMATGQATAAMAAALAKLRTDVVLVVGDRVEAMAAALAAHISGLVVAHVHGGDRALGQIDDSLRHAITKLAHIHFPATVNSQRRIAKLGEELWRIHRCGSPGVDGIESLAAKSMQLQKIYDVRPGHFALLLLHPTSPDDSVERRRAKMLLKVLTAAGVPRTIIVGPNNDPGSGGILRAFAGRLPAGATFHPSLPRSDFLGLLRDAAFLIGNSSSGIIEAASFGMPVIDVGDRQKGRDRGQNVRNVRFTEPNVRRAVRSIWQNGQPIRFTSHNIYGGGRAGERIAHVLARTDLNNLKLCRKLIAY